MWQPHNLCQALFGLVCFGQDVFIFRASSGLRFFNCMFTIELVQSSVTSFVFHQSKVRANAFWLCLVEIAGPGMEHVRFLVLAILAFRLEHI